MHERNDHETDTARHMTLSSFDHINAEDLTAYLDGELSGDAKARIQAHLAECDECRSEVVELSGALRPQRRSRRWTIAVPTAAAAAVAALLLLGPFEMGGDSRSADRLRPGSTVELEAVPEISVSRPGPGSTVGPEQIEFSWADMGGEATYRLTLTDEGGDPLWTVETTRSVVVLPEDVKLVPGRRYLWFVDALLADGTHATTGVQSFNVSR